MIHSDEKSQISVSQLFLLLLAQSGGAAIIFLPGVLEAGRDVWISNIIASIMAYIVVYTHYLPQSLSPGISINQLVTKYWGRFIGGLTNLYYFSFFFLLSCLIVSDIYFFGKITMPETPGFVFIIFFLIPAIYGVRLGLEVVVRSLAFLIPILAFIYGLLFILMIPKWELGKLLPIMGEGIKPVVAGAIPNLNFPWAQVLPAVFYFKYVRANSEGNDKILKYAFFSIFVATILLSLRALASAAVFDQETLRTFVFPPYSAVRLIELGDTIERIDILFLTVFFGTTFFKFALTYYVMCEMISEQFGVGETRLFALPLAVLIGFATPFLIPRIDIVFLINTPYFIAMLPLFFMVPLLLYVTIIMKESKKLRSRGNLS